MSTSSMRLALLASALAIPALAQAAPALDIRAYDVTSGTQVAVPLTVTSPSSSSIIGTGSNSNFSSVMILSTGAAQASGGLSTTTLDAAGVANTTLLLEITQTGLTATAATLPFAVTFTLNALTSSGGANVTYNTFIGPKNAAYGMGDPLVNNITLTGSSNTATFGATASASGLTAGGSYSETEFISINFTNTGSVTASSQIVPAAVPEPTSLALLGMGMAGLCAVGLRRRGAGGSQAAA